MSVIKLSCSMVIMTSCVKQSNSAVASGIAYWKWDIANLIQPQIERKMNYAVVILNRPIIQSKNFMCHFWNDASVRVTVDGGTRHFDEFVASEPNFAIKIPDLITGDFDSINESLLTKYQQKGSQVIHTPDQNYTDFTKSLMELNRHCTDQNIQLDQVISIGQASGRIDQIMGNIQTLFFAREKSLLHKNTFLYLLTDDALSWLLYPGDHCICIPDSVLEHRRVWCSLLPIGEKCASVTTSGLKWNLDNQTLRFGDVVSTSNTFSNEQEVKINCSHTLLWSMKLPQLIDK